MKVVETPITENTPSSPCCSLSKLVLRRTTCEGL